MNVRTLDEVLAAWVKRHGLQISDVYRNQFYYVDISDDTGGKYEISIFKEDQSELVKVRVWSDQKRSCGFAGVCLTDLERVLEQAFTRICKWSNRSLHQ